MAAIGQDLLAQGGVQAVEPALEPRIGIFYMTRTEHDARRFRAQDRQAGRKLGRVRAKAAHLGGIARAQGVRVARTLAHDVVPHPAPVEKALRGEVGRVDEAVGRLGRKGGLPVMDEAARHRDPALHAEQVR